MKELVFIIINLVNIFLISEYGLAEEMGNIAKPITTFRLILTLVIYIVIFLAVIIFALYGTKFIAKNFSGVTNGKYIKILDTISISTTLKIMIFEVNSMVYIVASSGESISLIDKFKLDDFQLIVDTSHTDSNNDINIVKILNKWKDKEEKNAKKF